MKKAIPFTIAVLSIAIVGCAIQSGVEKSAKSVKYSGHYNKINGKLSDGTKLDGIAWFQKGSSLGDFCFQADDMTCSGKYSAGAEWNIAGKLECSNQTTGTFQATRIPDGNFVTPIKASGNFSDGRTGTVNFGPNQTGSGTTICYK